MTQDTYSGLPKDKELAIQSYENWVLFVLFTFPDPVTNSSVKPAGERVRKWFREEGISYVCVFELSSEDRDVQLFEQENDDYFAYDNEGKLRRPHYHFIIDKYVDKDHLNRAWHQALGHRADVRVKPVRAGSIETLYGYVQKQQSSVVVRHRAKNIYDMVYTLLVDGPLFSLWLNHVRSVLALSDPQIDLKRYVVSQRYREAQRKLEIETLGQIENDESQIESDFHNVLRSLVSHGSRQFEKELADFLKLDGRRDYHRQPLTKFFFEYLKGLPANVILKISIFKVLRMFRRPIPLVDFTHDLYVALIGLSGELDKIEKSTSYRSPLPLFAESLHNSDLKIIHYHMLGLYDMIKSIYGSILTFEDSDGKLSYSIKSSPFETVLKNVERQSALFDQFPMICLPKPWTGSELRLNYNFSGGFLLNGESIRFPLCTSLDFNITSTLVDTTSLTKINAKQSCAYTINRNYFDAYIQSKLWVSDEQYNDAKKYLQTHKQWMDKEDLTFTRRKRLKKANENVSHWIHQRKIKEAFDSFLPKVQELMQDDSLTYDTLFLYLVAMVDGRMRSYQRSWFSIATSKLCRYMAQAPIPAPFDLNTFKFYTAKVFLGSVDRRDELRRVVFFNDVLHPLMLSFRGNHCYMKAKEKEAFLACCVEYEQFNKYMEKFSDNRELGLRTYRSKFFANMDQTSSGNQLLALLFRCGTFAEYLNMTDSDRYSRPRNVYLEFYGDYKNKFIAPSHYQARWDEFKLDLPQSYKNLNMEFLDLGGDEEGAIFDRQKHVFLKPFKSLLMTLPYNKKESTFAAETRAYFYEIGFLRNLPNREEAYKFLVETIWEFVHGSVIGVYLSFMAKIVHRFSKYKLPIFVKTLVRTNMGLFYRNVKLESVTRLIRAGKNKGKRKKEMMLALPQQGLSFRKIGNAFPANFVHACDGSLVLHFAEWMAKHYPFYSYWSVHDCFGFTTYKLRFFIDKLCDLNRTLFCDEDYLMAIIDDFAAQLERAPIRNASEIATNFRKEMTAELVRIRLSFEKPFTGKDFRRPYNFYF